MSFGNFSLFLSPLPIFLLFGLFFPLIKWVQETNREQKIDWMLPFSYNFIHLYIQILYSIQTTLRNKYKNRGISLKAKQENKLKIKKEKKSGEGRDEDFNDIHFPAIYLFLVIYSQTLPFCSFEVLFQCLLKEQIL